MPSHTPRNFEQWLQSIELLNPCYAFSPDIAQLLRITAGLTDYAVLLCSGTSTLAYVPWLRDGMSMNSRLLIHLAAESGPAEGLLTQQTQADIRVAGHRQQTEEFLGDISHHRMNLLLLELTDDCMQCMPEWQTILADNGLLVLLGQAERLQKMRAAYADQFFFAAIAPTAGNAGMVLMTRKGLQHTASRRGGRSRRKTRV